MILRSVLLIALLWWTGSAAHATETIALRTEFEAKCSLPSDQRLEFSAKMRLPSEIVFLVGDKGRFRHVGIQLNGAYYGARSDDVAVATTASVTISSGFVDINPNYSHNWDWLSKYDYAAQVRISANEMQLCAQNISIQLVYELIDSTSSPRPALRVLLVPSSRNLTTFAESGRQIALGLIAKKYASDIALYLADDFGWFRTPSLNYVTEARDHLVFRRSMARFFSSISDELLVQKTAVREALVNWPKGLRFIHKWGSRAVLRVPYSEGSYLDFANEGASLQLIDVMLDGKRLPIRYE